MAHFDELMQRALTVRNNVAPSSNTATLVGGVLVSIVSALQLLLDTKQGTLTFDTTPTDGSTNPVTSNGIYDAIIDAIAAIDLSACEKIVNKVTAIDDESTDVQYPTAKLLYDSLQALASKYAASHHTHLISDLTNAEALFTQFALNSGVVSITIGGQQRSITLPTAATPSGDPMHYVYEKLGCSYNAQTGLWTYRDLDDLTTEQVNNAYVFTASERNLASKTAQYRVAAVRFNFSSDTVFQDNQVISLDRFVQGNTTIEHVYINGSADSVKVMCTTTLTNMAMGCTKLVGIHNILIVQNIYVETDPAALNKSSFNGCPQLTYLRLRGLKNTLYYLHRDTALSLDSIVYLVVNAAPTAAARYVLHTNAMARCTADTAEYTYQGNTYTGIVALAAARGITLTDVLPS